MKMKVQEETVECECLAERMTAGQSASTISPLDPTSMICKVTTAYVLLADRCRLVPVLCSPSRAETGMIGLMKSLTRTTILLALLFCCAGVHHLSHSQTKTSKKVATATVSGRVTVGGEGRGGIFVGVGKNNFTSSQTAPRNAMTDAEGNYRISDVPPGSYYVAPMSALFVLGDSNPDSQLGKQLIL